MHPVHSMGLQGQRLKIDAGGDGVKDDGMRDGRSLDLGFI